MLDQQGYTLKLGELFKKIVSNSGVQDWDKILVEKTPQEMADSVLQQDAMKLQQMIAQMQAQGSGMNQVPPQPQGPPMGPQETSGAPQIGGPIG